MGFHEFSSPYDWSRIAAYKRTAKAAFGGMIDLSVGSPVDPVPIRCARRSQWRRMIRMRMDIRLLQVLPIYVPRLLNGFRRLAMLICRRSMLMWCYRRLQRGCCVDGVATAFR